MMKKLATHLSIRSIFIYVLAFSIPLGLENISETFKAKASESQGSWYSPLFTAAFWYQRIVTMGPRKPRAHFVRLVTISTEKEGADLLSNACDERSFMAKLVEGVAAANPAVIVIDAEYDRDFCKKDMTSTNQLQRAIGEVSRNVPVVLGLNSYDEEELGEDKDLQAQINCDLSQLRRNGFADPQQILDPNPLLEFPPDRVTFGLMRGDYDQRRIPLSWPTYRNCSEVGHVQPQNIQTMVKAAAAAYDPRMLKQERFKELENSEENPFTSFLGEDELPTYSGIELICNPSHVQNKEWTACSAGEGNHKYLADLIHRVVVIGERDPEGGDFYETVIGEVPGVTLIANYIESLLDDRYFKPFPDVFGFPLSEFLISAAAFCVIEVIFSERRAVFPVRPLLYGMSVPAVLWLLTYWEALQWGYYLVIWPPSVIAILGKFGNLLLIKQGKRGREKGGKKKIWKKTRQKEMKPSFGEPE